MHSKSWLKPMPSWRKLASTHRFLTRAACVAFLSSVCGCAPSSPPPSPSVRPVAMNIDQVPVALLTTPVDPECLPALAAKQGTIGVEQLEAAYLCELVAGRIDRARFGQLQAAVLTRDAAIERLTARLAAAEQRPSP